MVRICHIFVAILTAVIAPAQNLRVEHYNVSNGLSGDRIFSLAQDSLGFIWCASHWGIDRLDGRDVRFYSPQYKGETVNMYSYKTKIRTCGNHVYVATQQGLVFSYDPYSDSFKVTIDLSEFGADGKIMQNDIYAVKDGRMYLATSAGLYRYSSSGATTPVDSRRPVECVTGDGGNTVYYSSEGILYRYSSGLQQQVAEFDESITSLHYLGRCVYIGTFAGDLYIYDENTNELLKSKALSRKVRITSICNGRPGELLIGTDGAGCHVYDLHADSIVRTFSNTAKADGNALSGNSVMDVMSDRDGNIWIATFSSAVSMIRNGRSRCQIITPPSEETVGNAMIRLRDGKVCYASDYGIRIHDVDADSWYAFGDDMSPKGPVLKLAEDNEGNIWAGGFGYGILRINPLTGECAQYTKDRPLFGVPLHSDYISSMAIHDDNLWLGSFSDGNLMKYDLAAKQGRSYEIHDVNSIAVADDNTVLCGQSVRLTLLNPHTGKTGMVSTNVAINDILLMGSKAWLATSGKGIMVFDLKTHKLSELISDNAQLRYVMAMKRAADGNSVYITTQKQLYEIDIRSGSVSDLGRIVGLNPTTFNGQAICLLSPARLLLGSSQSTIAVDIGDDLTKKDTPYIYFTDLKVAYSIIHPDAGDPILPVSLDCVGRLELPYGQNSFSIGFSMIDFRESNFLEFEYRLAPFEDEWVSETDRHASYTNVPPGKYTFQLRLKDSRSGEVVAEKELKVIIDNPIWTKPWMYAVYVVFAAFLCWLIIRLAGSRLKQSYSEEKMKLFTEMAHELRTPVALIKAPLSELADNRNLSDDNRATLEIAIRNTDRLHELTTQLLDFQKADANAMTLNTTTVDIHEFLTMRLGPWEYKARLKGLGFHTDIDSLQGVVTAIDMAKMDAILTNLLSNALKYTDSGSVSIKGWTEDERYCISFTDTGIGIPANEMKHLFRQFFRAKNARLSEVAGTGIGLMLTHKLVELHGGGISVSSKENTGSTFVLRFPIRHDDSIEPGRVEKTPPSLHDETVLVIDDNPDMRDVLKKSLEHNYNVTTAKDGVDAIASISDHMPDIIVSDLMMPRMNGEELCHQLKSNVGTSHIPFILLTAVSDRISKTNAFEYGADDYITKPFDNTELKARIRIHLRNARKLKESLQSTDTNTDEVDFLNPLDREFMEKLTALIEKNIDNPEYSVSAMSSDMAMSRGTLYNKLKAVAGQSPNDFIRLQRLKKAADLLRQNRYPIAEVAFMTGFPDTKYFATVFKRQFGCTPSAYKKQ